MKQFLYLLLFLSISTFSQNFENVDAKVLKYPKFSNPEDLVKQIEKKFNSDTHKARATFFWLAKNIKYNLQEYYNPTQRSYSFNYFTEEEKEQKLQAIKDKLVADTFLNKTGVCEEYAQSFKKICDLLGLESEVIKGYVRNEFYDIGVEKKNTNHAWNAVKLNGKWEILDITWAAGYLYNGKWIRDFDNYYYNIPKENIFKTHLPEDSIWILRFGRITKEAFFNQPIYKKGILNTDITLLSPKKGILNVKSTEKINLKFKNLKKNTKLFYMIKDVKYAKKPTISIDKDITTVTIKNPQKNTELILYIKKEGTKKNDAIQFEDVLHFKIQII